MTWRENGWYVLGLAEVLDTTPQKILEQSWDELVAQLDEDQFYRVAMHCRCHNLNTEFYTKRHIEGLRSRGKL